MKSFGIYTLANDVVYDQLVALLNSIEVNVSTDIPVCIIPYDNRLEKVKQEIITRKNVTLFENKSAIKTWDNFVNQFWEAHSRARDSKLSRPAWYQGFVHRKFAAFDGEFDKFVFFDADSLAMKPLDDIFEKLDEYDLVFNDWEHKKPRELTELDLSIIEEITGLTEDEIRPKLHCDSFFGSKKSLFSANQLEEFKKRAIERGEVEWVRSKSWWSSSGLFSYMTFPGNLKIFNFTRSNKGQERTGNCADADPFVNINNVLYNEEGLKPIHRIHYMNYSSSDFAKLCLGRDANIRYKHEFLHYRFLKEPDKKPQQLQPPNLLTKTNEFLDKIVKKVKLKFM
ncbi:hypothetical protein VB711_06250 [Cronbergia sp. UHCC 0137]|uniref:Npun_R2821/Npun_R2822 family protein n=1 Tax=Cronbergia sp. UHCC 0137 TaxID=3110239 RepID=UPI002B21AD86|nr:Npun_R2821/Npun_R2822 family protein [Cronbergia sp. UHCC 0137]MEA5617438.1 hypothetical protein [Cronbergia sp. UHCC 0137]